MIKIIAKVFIITALFVVSNASYAQKSIAELSGEVSKGEYGILEVRLNMEDEFRTLEGRESQGLARISIYTGKNQKNEMITKGFEGFNIVVSVMNQMNKNGWKLVDTYPIRGNSLIITHYVFEKVKK